MTDKKPPECYRCQSYTPIGCNKNMPGFPDVGAFCISFYSESGTDWKETQYSQDLDND